MEISSSFYDMLNFTCEFYYLLIQLLNVLRFILVTHLLKTLRLIYVLPDLLLLFILGWFVFSFTRNVVIPFAFTLWWWYYVWTEGRSIFIYWRILSLILNCTIFWGYLMSRYLVIWINLVVIFHSLNFSIDFLLSQ